MGTTAKQDREFVSYVFGNMDVLLSDAINWISQNISPEDVYTNQQLSDWAAANGYLKKEE